MHDCFQELVVFLSGAVHGEIPAAVCRKQVAGQSFKFFSIESVFYKVHAREYASNRTTMYLFGRSDYIFNTLVGASCK